MPCNDVTEVIEVVLDRDDRLKDYRFSKRTCGQGVGAQSLLIDQLGGRPLDELLVMTAEEFLAEYPIDDPVEEFLSLKHLFAVQGALEVLTGKEPGGKDDPFAVAEVAFDNGETVFHGRIYVDLLTEKIASCGGCKGCGADKKERSQGTRTPRRKKNPAVVFN